MQRIHELMVRGLAPGEYTELYCRSVQGASSTAVEAVAAGFRASQLLAEPTAVLVERPR